METRQRTDAIGKFEGAPDPLRAGLNVVLKALRPDVPLYAEVSSVDALELAPEDLVCLEPPAPAPHGWFKASTNYVPFDARGQEVDEFRSRSQPSWTMLCARARSGRGSRALEGFCLYVRGEALAHKLLHKIRQGALQLQALPSAREPEQLALACGLGASA